MIWKIIRCFGQLSNYKNKEFYDEHKIIKISTDEEDTEYEIISVFSSKIFSDDDINTFVYYNYYNFENEEIYNEYISKSKAEQLYNTGVSAKYGEQIITLVTCEYAEQNGRIVIVAKKVT